MTTKDNIVSNAQTDVTRVEFKRCGYCGCLCDFGNFVVIPLDIGQEGLVIYQDYHRTCWREAARRAASEHSKEIS